MSTNRAKAPQVKVPTAKDYAVRDIEVQFDRYRDSIPLPTSLMFPIYIPSRGRADTATTPRLLQESGVPFILVVEPQDQTQYRQHFPDSEIFVMQENNQGISYARNACLSHAQQSNKQFHWQVDDNIRSFGIRSDNKNKTVHPAGAFWVIEQLVNSYSNVGAAGMKHQAFAFAEKQSVSLNRQVYSSMLLRTDTGSVFRDKLIEDTDFSLQLLTSGYCTLLFNRVIMNKTTTMAMKGGNTEIHHSGSGRIDRAIELQKMWPGIFSLKDSPTGPRIAPTRVWAKFPQLPIAKRTSQAE